MSPVNHDSTGININLNNVQLTNPLNGNKGGHWAGRAKKAKEQRTFAKIVTSSKIYGPDSTKIDLSGPLVITITRISSGTLDDDSLPASAKHIRDGVADALKVKDNDPRITWRYAAEKAKRGTWGCRINITPAPAKPGLMR